MARKVTSRINPLCRITLVRTILTTAGIQRDPRSGNSNYGRTWNTEEFDGQRREPRDF